LAVETYGYSKISMGPDGLPTGKQDIDIWYNPTISNYYKIIKVLDDLGRQLVNQLRELEEDKIIERKIYAEIPPKVEYKMTKYGHSLMPVIDVIQQWGLKDLKKVTKQENEYAV